MKVRITPGTAASPWLTAVTCATLTVLVSAAVSACTSSPGPTAPDIPSPSGVSTALHSSTAKASPTLAHVPRSTATAGHTGRSSLAATPSHAGTGPASHKDSATDSPSRSAAPTRSAAAAPAHSRRTPRAVPPKIPVGAPGTGGGGTAGLQDGLLFGIGGAAIVAGLGSLGYRRRLTRATPRKLLLSGGGRLF